MSLLTAVAEDSPSSGGLSCDEMGGFLEDKVDSEEGLVVGEVVVGVPGWLNLGDGSGGAGCASLRIEPKSA